MPDSVVAKVLRSAVGLRAGGDAATGHEVLATYRSAAGEDVFALCREGLLLLSPGEPRYIANADVADVRIPPDVKTVASSRKLILRLTSGEDLELSVDGQCGNFLDVFPVHAWLRRRVHQQRRAIGAPAGLP